MAKRKSIIRKKIGRKIQTKQYESLEVYVDIEEEIEWENLKERSEKTKSVTLILQKDFKETMLTVLDQLKLSQNKATINTQSNVASEEFADKVKQEVDSI